MNSNYLRRASPRSRVMVIASTFAHCQSLSDLLAKMTPIIDPVPIKLKDICRLDAIYKDGQYTGRANIEIVYAPNSFGPSSIRITNWTPEPVVAVLSRKFNEILVPIHVTRFGIPDTGGMEVIVPGSRYAVWIDMDVQTGSTIPKTLENVFEFDMTSVKTTSAQWDGVKFVTA